MYFLILLLFFEIFFFVFICVVSIIENVDISYCDMDRFFYLEYDKESVLSCEYFKSLCY